MLICIGQISTASMGKFDEKSHEKEPEVKRKKKKEKIDMNRLNSKDEKERNLQILKNLTKK